jgi:hypothetical protein
MNMVRPSRSLMRVWTVVFVSVLAIALLLLFVSRAGQDREQVISSAEDPAAGTLTVMDGKRPVLTYRFDDQLPPGLDGKQVRSCYIHPLYSLDGEVLTADFPADHLHHHGLFWTWPAVTVRGEATQTWHPAEPLLRQHNVLRMMLKREAYDEATRFHFDNIWKLRDSEDVVEEWVDLLVYEASPCGRAIDISISLSPIGGPLELHGAAQDNKGYGGLCFRGAPLFKGAVMTTDQGPLAEDSTGRTFRWADLSTPDLGVAIFVSPDHPGYALTWLVRNSYAGVLNPCWPGLAGARIRPDTGGVELRYRIYVHRGDASAGRVKEAYVAYISGRDR